MSFKVFAPLFNKIDAVTTTFVTDISSKAIAEITPIVTVGLTLMFIFYGLLIMRGAIEMPMMDFLGRSIKIALITGIALAGGLYQSHIAEVIIKTPDELASVLITGGTQGEGAAFLIDESAAKGFSVAGDAFEKSGFFTDTGVLYAVFGVIILFATGVLVAIGGAFILIAKVGLAILTGLGPFFIVALLFQSTQRFFEMWVSQVLNYVLLIIIFSAVFGLMMSIYSSYIVDVELDGIINVSYTLGGAIIMSVAMGIVLWQLPAIATGLAGGASVSLAYPKRLRRGRSNRRGNSEKDGNSEKNTKDK
jgi:type IV secretion system protein VirB6